MSARNGKIAKLPIEIRDELNTRLFKGEPANRLVDWLNSQSAVLAVLEASFEGRPISEQNVSEWKQGGYFEWLALREPSDDAGDLEASACGAASGMTSGRLLEVLAVRHAEMIKMLDIAHEDLFVRRLAALERLTNCAVAMRKCELQTARVALERERLELLREKQRGPSSGAAADRSTNPVNSSPASGNPDDPSNSPQSLESPENDSGVHGHAAECFVHSVHPVHLVHLVHEPRFEAAAPAAPSVNVC